MATTYTFKAMDLAGVPGPGRGRGRVQAGRRQPAQGARPRRHRHRRQVPLQGAQRRALRPRQAQGPGGRVAAARDDGHLRNADPARAVRARAADRVEAPGRHAGGGPQGRRGGSAAVGLRSRVTPRSSVPLYVVDGARGGDRRCARGMPPARRRPAREGRRAAPPGARGDGLPGAGDHASRSACCSRWSRS